MEYTFTWLEFNTPYLSFMVFDEKVGNSQILFGNSLSLQVNILITFYLSFIVFQSVCFFTTVSTDRKREKKDRMDRLSRYKAKFIWFCNIEK